MSFGMKEEQSIEFTWFRRVLILSTFFLSLIFAGMGLAMARLVAVNYFGGNMVTLFDAALAIYLPFLGIVITLAVGFAIIELFSFFSNIFKKSTGRRINDNEES
jgi:hypothetical protein